MKYKNAADILPEELLEEVQKYASGEMIYIPKRSGKKEWGERSGARDFYTVRNREIRNKRRNGMSIQDLAREYGLSGDSIRRILYR